MATEGSVISLICIKSKYLMKWPGLWQKEIVREKKAHIEKEGDCTDTLIILQHPSVYTLGTASMEENLQFDKKKCSVFFPALHLFSSHFFQKYPKLHLFLKFGEKFLFGFGFVLKIIFSQTKF
ncbi:hypothetical protein GLYMA_08G314300v4 [Glycine max]|uniref:BPL/LPL catalytic domain-containing protein n=1 Tax=Glycine max TaxID=3847 RepID=K7LA28_SOYBN|nr:hypothetical protein JHK86_023160 [Glycine max]KAH1054038.1 hypothetical protein GYH30_023017 [Glycine max]KRH46132.1 hypothetical protein GLYMA_08G314300v4 [Glycine max]